MTTKSKGTPHAEHAKRAGVSTPCTAAHVNFGGSCLNCGWEPTPQVYIPRSDTSKGTTPGALALARLSNGTIADFKAPGYISEAVVDLRALIARAESAERSLKTILIAYKMAMMALHRSEADFEASSEVVAARAVLAGK